MLTGNFDGQGVSFGALQWNFGQGTLQPLLQEMFNSHREIAATIFEANLESLEQAINSGTAACLSPLPPLSMTKGKTALRRRGAVCSEHSA